MFGDTECPETAPGVQLSSRTPKVADTWGAAGASLDKGDGKAPRRSQTTPKLLKAQCSKAGAREGGDRRAVSPRGTRWAAWWALGSSELRRLLGVIMGKSERAAPPSPLCPQVLTLSQPVAGVRWIWGRNKGLQERC